MNFNTIIAFKFFMWYDKINGHLWPQNFSTLTRKNQEKWGNSYFLHNSSQILNVKEMWSEDCCWQGNPKGVLSNCQEGKPKGQPHEVLGGTKWATPRTPSPAHRPSPSPWSARPTSPRSTRFSPRCMSSLWSRGPRLSPRPVSQTSTSRTRLPSCCPRRAQPPRRLWALAFPRSPLLRRPWPLCVWPRRWALCRRWRTRRPSLICLSRPSDAPSRARR